MFKQKWVILKESKNFRIYIPLKLFKKIEKRAKKGLSTTIAKVEDIRVEAKDPEALRTILETFFKEGRRTKC